MSFTPGPWAWRLNPKSKSVLLESSAWVVMAFDRWGMAGATPVFAQPKPRILTRAVEFGKVIPGREHHKHWALDLDHPDARLIAAAPELLAALKDVIECSGTCGYDCEQGKLDDARRRASALIARVVGEEAARGHV